MPATQTDEPIIINPTMEKIITATCTHFLVSEDILKAGTSFNIAYMRWCVFYLVKKNTQLSERFIGCRLERARNPVRNGIENIEVRKKIYRQTMDDLQKIKELAGISFL